MPKNSFQVQQLNRLLQRVLKLAGIAVMGLIVFAVYVFLQSPAAIRTPQFEHAHFRMQLLINGTAEHFGSSAYQTTYQKNQCFDELTKEPIHFHDNKDQYIHLHWRHITGGMVLKYYGLNYIGGLGDALGYRFDGVANFKPVPIHGKAIPVPPEGTRLFVYVGDEHGHKLRSTDDFMNLDLETFFNKPSNVPLPETSWLDTFFAKAKAHAGHEHAQESLSEINNVLGNVVIFVQSQEPSVAEVTARFQKLEPLSESTCGG